MTADCLTFVASNRLPAAEQVVVLTASEITSTAYLIGQSFALHPFKHRRGLSSVTYNHAEIMYGEFRSD